MTVSKQRHFLFFAVVALFNLAASFAHPITPTLFKGLHLQDYMFGVALACMMFGNFLFSPFWGKISGFINSRNTLFISCMGYAVGQLFFALAQTQWQFILARFFAGVFAGGIFVGILTYIVNTAPDEKTRGKYLVSSATLQAVCNSLGYFVGGMLGEIHVYVAVMAQAVTLAACGVLFRLVCAPDASAPLKSAPKGTLMREANPFRAFVQGRRFITFALALLLGIGALQNLSQTAFDQSFNYYVIDQIGFSTGYNGLIKFVMGMVTLVANSTLCVWLMQKTDNGKSIIGVLLVCTASMVAVLVISALVPFLTVSILFYALSSISVPLIQNLIADEGRGQDSNLVMGFYNSLKSFGGIIGALVAGFTYVVSPKTPFICCAAGFAVATLCALVYRRRAAARRRAALPKEEA